MKKTNHVSIQELKMLQLGKEHEAVLEKLVREVGWGLPPGRLAAMLAIGYGVGHFDGRQLVASSILFPYGQGLAFLGMVIVHPRWQRHGLGSALVRECLREAKERGIVQVGLLATDMGYPLYQSLGFVTADRAHRYIGVPKPERVAQSMELHRGIQVSELRERDWDDLILMDARVTGADRRDTYEVFVHTVTKSVVARDEYDRLRGYAMATAVDGLLMLGPVHADSDDVAKRLVTPLIADVKGRVRIDVPSLQTGFMKQLETFGLVDTHVSPMMSYGRDAFPGSRECLYGVMDAALG